MSLVLRGRTVPGLQAMASELAARHLVIREANMALLRRLWSACSLLRIAQAEICSC